MKYLCFSIVSLLFLFCFLALIPEPHGKYVYDEEFGYSYVEAGV